MRILKQHHILIASLLLASLFFISGCEQEAPQSKGGNVNRIVFEHDVHDKQVGNYIFHINGLTTDQLSADVARGYNISRSKDRAMLILSVREKNQTEETPIKAEVKVNTRNLNNQSKSIKFREIIETKEPIAIYYIGETSVANEETLIFELDVTPANSDKSFLLSYSQRFFTE